MPDRLGCSNSSHAVFTRLVLAVRWLTYSRTCRYVAKRYNQSSVLGSYLDPLADKVLIGCVIGALGYQVRQSNPAATGSSCTAVQASAQIAATSIIHSFIHQQMTGQSFFTNICLWDSTCRAPAFSLLHLRQMHGAA